MDQSLDRKNNLKESLQSFLRRNKLKLISIIVIIFIFLISLFIWSERKEKINIILSEKFIKAGLLVSEGKLKEARNFYEEILSYENKFYSLLALNTILEKNLEDDKEIILNHFVKLEKINYSEQTLDLINLKKALYLIKINEDELGKKILTNLINKESNIKDLAQEIIK